MELGRMLAPIPIGLRDRRHGIEHLLADRRVVAVGPGQPFGSRLAAIGRVRADAVATLGLGRLG
jgi:hypothetical protein